jgi:hypothetical protein
VLSEANTAAVLEAVRWALEEDASDAVMLSPRLLRTRLRGGAQSMRAGYNTQFPADGGIPRLSVVH